MSISDTNAKARAAGMTYGQYLDARDRGLLHEENPSSKPKQPEEKLAPNYPTAVPVSNRIQWTVELKNDLRRLLEEGLSVEEIGERLGIGPEKIRTQLGHMKYREGYVPPKQIAKKPTKKKAAPQSKPEKNIKSTADVSEKSPSVYDSTDPMCILGFLKHIVSSAFNADEITAIFATREDSIAEIQYKICEDLWHIQVHKE